MLTEALERELLEETGLTIGDIRSVAYVVQVHDQAPQLHEGRSSGPGHLWTTFVFEVGTWTGDLESRDPDGLVLEPCFLPMTEALHVIEEHPVRVMREPMLAYFRRDAAARSVWLYRRDLGGEDTLLARLPIRSE